MEFQCISKSTFPDNMTQAEIDQLSPGEKDLRKLYGHSIEVAETLASPRTIKSHLPFQILPQDLLDKAKVVYVARRPWDTCASLHNHVTQAYPFSHRFEGDYTDFVRLFRQEHNMYGSYWNHLQVSMHMIISQLCINDIPCASMIFAPSIC